MATERQIQETIARCVSCMDFYVNSYETRWSRAVMSAEIQTVASLVTQWGWSSQATDDSILGPVQAELIARYGPEAGGILNTEFVGAFQGSLGQNTHDSRRQRRHFARLAGR
jgi:hypothetical protein